MNTLNPVKQAEGLPWGEPKKVSTARGPRVLRTAAAAPLWWGLWRAAKAELQAAGFSCGKDRDGQWEVCWWQPDPDAPREAAVAPPAPAGVQTTSPGPENSTGAPPARPTEAVRPQADPEALAKITFSDEQLAVFEEVRTGDGNIVVEALAGTGKTFTVVHALPLFRGERGAYVVFNAKNRAEAKQKVTDPRVDVHSHNSFGFMFVRQVWPDARPAGRDEDIEFERAERAVGEDTAQEVKVAVCRLVRFLKNTFVEPTQAQAEETARERDIEAAGFEDEANGGWNAAKLAKAALRVLELSLEQEPDGRISFDDQVWLAVRKGWVRAWYDFLVVDETQDMNSVQLEMVRRAVRPGGRVMIVGDQNQCIYAFRGAEMDGMERMTAELKARVLGLTESRRCGQAVAREAQSLVPRFHAHPSNPEGSVGAAAEARLPELARPGDAVISRKNAPLMALCLKLLKQGTPARIQGRDVGKALAAVVRKLRAKSVPDFLRRLEAWAAKQRARCKGLKSEKEKLEEIRDTRETLEAVAEGCSGVGEIAARLERLFSDEGDRPQVVLSSVHKAKGLEWDRVFLIRSTFQAPRRQPGAPDPRQEREERNIRYVAITRARRDLVWCEDPRGEGRG